MRSCGPAEIAAFHIVSMVSVSLLKLAIDVLILWIQPLILTFQMSKLRLISDT